MDKDGDGKISDEERAAAMKERSEKMRARLDTNGDGKLTPDELANSKGRMKFDDPAALDTNHDGDISADELQAGIQARRDEMRAQRMKDRATEGSGATDQP
jgi:Ca2+-binding EF-hand superfamily protein